MHVDAIIQEYMLKILRLTCVINSGVASRDWLVVLSALYTGMGGANHSSGRGFDI